MTCEEGLFTSPLPSGKTYACVIKLCNMIQASTMPGIQAIMFCLSVQDTMTAYLLVREIAPHIIVEMIADKLSNSTIGNAQLIIGTPNCIVFQLAANFTNMNTVRCLIFDDCEVTATYRQVTQLFGLAQAAKVFVTSNVPDESMLQNINSTTNRVCRSSIEVGCTTDHFTMVFGPQKKSKLIALNAICQAVSNTNNRAIIYCKV